MPTWILHEDINGTFGLMFPWSEQDIQYFSELPLLGADQVIDWQKRYGWLWRVRTGVLAVHLVGQAAASGLAQTGWLQTITCYQTWNVEQLGLFAKQQAVLGKALSLVRSRDPRPVVCMWQSMYRKKTVPCYRLASRNWFIGIPHNIVI